MQLMLVLLNLFVCMHYLWDLHLLIKDPTRTTFKIYKIQLLLVFLNLFVYIDYLDLWDIHSLLIDPTRKHSKFIKYNCYLFS